MTANEVYINACALIFEQPEADTDFKNYFLNFLNILLAEALPYQNYLLKIAGEPEITAPTVTSFDEAIPYNNELCRTALPYGIVSFYFQDENDNFKSQDYRARYISALEDIVKKGAVTDITDEYSSYVVGDDEDA